MYLFSKHTLTVLYFITLYHTSFLPFPRSYAMMYIAMNLQQELLAMFPEAPEDDILKVVGNLLYYRCMNPAPDALDVVDVGMDNQLSPDQVGVGVEWIVRSTIFCLL